MSRLCVCGRPIPLKATVDGVERGLRSRRYCLTCVPFRGHNNRNAGEAAGRGKTARGARFRRWQEKARRERKALLVALLGGRCSRRGYDRCVAALEFHHREPAEKRFNLSANNLLRRWELVQEEAAKCDLVCTNCHRQIEDELWRAAMERAATEPV